MSYMDLHMYQAIGKTRLLFGFGTDGNNKFGSGIMDSFGVLL